MYPQAPKDYPQRPISVRQACIISFCLTLILTLGQGIARYHNEFGLTGEQFIARQQFDAQVHVTLAQRIMNGQGYTLPIDNPRGPDKVEPAFEKAPGYPYFLAALFSITGIGWSFFPVQCLFGSILSVLAVLIAVEIFGDPIVGLVAGISAAVDPILVNVASQLYNENIYFCLFFFCIWLYLRWYRKPSAGIALAAGLVAGVNGLIREAILLPVAALIAWRVIQCWKNNRAAALKSAVLMSAGIVVVILPWTIHNYVVSHEFVPISTISQDLMGNGNNECEAAEGWTTPFFGLLPCRPNDAKREALVRSWGKNPDLFLWASRGNEKVAIQFIKSHPGAYIKLCIRRAWTAFNPWQPSAHLNVFHKIIMGGYFLVFVFGGIAAAIWLWRRGAPELASVLYVLVLASYLPQVAVFVAQDHRYSPGLFTLLAMFLGAWVASRYRSWRLEGKVARAS